MENLSRVAGLILLFLCISVFPRQTLASPRIIINEIAWMGTGTSYNDEWIELFNNASSPVDLNGWKLVAQDGNPEINLGGVISARSFYLLERTDDNTVPNIPADLTYTGALENEGEAIELYDGFGNLIDSVNCSNSWFGGDNKSKQTMERKPGFEDGSGPLNWTTSKNPGGTPRDENSGGPDIAKIQPESLSDKDEKNEMQPVKGEPTKATYPSGILVQEILPSPLGADEEEEWIEISNENSYDVDISGWQISDVAGAVTSYLFEPGTIIKAKSFLVLARPITKITLNNNGDELNIIQPNGNVLDTITYEKAPRGQSYNRTESGWAWSAILTPGSVNVAPSSTLEAKATKYIKETIEESASSKESQESQAQKQLAAIGEQIPNSSKSLYVFLIALAVAVFSGAIIFILKRKIKSLT